MKDAQNCSKKFKEYSVVHLVTMPSTQTMEPMNSERSSLGVTRRETKGPSNPTRTCSPSFKYLGSIDLAASVTASQKGCMYSLGFLRILKHQKQGQQIKTHAKKRRKIE